MCIVCISTVTVASLLAPTQAPSEPEYGQKNIQQYEFTNKACSKSMLNKVKDNTICLKNGKVYRWAVKKTNTPSTTKTKEPVPTPTPTPTPAESVSSKYFKTPCDVDPLTPQEWKEFESWFKNQRGCIGPLRVPVDFLKSEPTTKQSGSLDNIEECKIKNNRQKQNTLAFPTADQKSYWDKVKHPGPNSVFQVVPIYTRDAPQNGKSPANDYGKYFDFISEWIKSSSDNGSSVKFNVPKNYLEFDKNISDYNLIHERTNENALRFNRDLVSAVDKHIDFSSADFVIIVLPAGSRGGIVQQAGLMQINTNEGSVSTSIFPPYNVSSFYPASNFLHPMWWIHEMQHVSLGFDDNSIDGTDAMSQFGVMSRYAASDLLGWHKWLAEYWEDKQVSCISKTETSLTWIAPSSTKTNKKKLIVIPITSSRVVVIESLRSVGLNYKMPAESEGALVYVVDTSLTSSHDGMRVLLPGNRKIVSPTFNNSDAPLKIKDYVLIHGLKISVVESGEFGDVVKVEKQ